MKSFCQGHYLWATIDSKLMAAFLSIISHCCLGAPTPDGGLLPFIWEICSPCYVAVAVLLCRDSQCSCHSASKGSWWIAFYIKFSLPAVATHFCTVAISLRQQPMLMLMPHHCTAMLLLSALFLCRNIAVTTHWALTAVVTVPWPWFHRCSLCHHCDAFMP